MSTCNQTSPEKQAPSKSDGDKFTRDQFVWLRQVAFDNALPPTASRVATALTKYFNREHDGWAWMSQATLALDLGMPLRTVQFAFAALIRGGHLITKRRGRTETSLYHLALKDQSDTQPIADHEPQSIADQVGVNRKIRQSDTQKTARVIRNPLRTNPLKEHSEESVEENQTLPLDLGEEEPTARQSLTLDVEGAFESFWNQYPRKVDKAAAKKAYQRVIAKKQATPDELLTGAMRYAAERCGQDSKYTKHPTTWLNAGSWANEAPAPPIAASLVIDQDGAVISTPPPTGAPAANPHEARLDARLAALAAKGDLSS